jgi:hypothetical protein
VARPPLSSASLGMVVSPLPSPVDPANAHTTRSRATQASVLVCAAVSKRNGGRKIRTTMAVEVSGRKNIATR